MPSHFDLIAIGGGSGGIAAVNRAASHGAKCALVEPDRLGGTCVNRGCVPKKVMWYASSIADTLADIQGYGFDVRQNNVNWKTLVTNRESYIHRLNDIYANRLQSNDVTLLNDSRLRFLHETYELD